MAESAPIGMCDGELFVGEDKRIRLEVVTKPNSAGVRTPVNVSGWTTKLVVTAEDDDEELITLDGVVEGTYDAVRANNTQRVVFLMDESDTQDMSAGMYQYSAKRTDDGSETILAFGPFRLQQTTQA